MTAPTPTPASTHRVVVVGSGFGGLFATKALDEPEVAVTMVARTSHHLFQPLLYQVATGIQSESVIAPTTRDVLANQDNVQVMLRDDTIDDALELRGGIYGAFEMAEVAAAAGRHDAVRRLLTFVVVGAGPTGVEMAGQLAELSRRTLTKEFRHIEPGSARIILLDAADA